MNYEPKDASVRVIGATAGIIAFLVVGSIAASAWLYAARTHEATRASPRQTSFTNGPAQKPDIARDSAAVMHDAKDRLSGYGWVDRDAGIARIPIERAIELTAKGIKPAEAPKVPGQVP